VNKVLKDFDTVLGRAPRALSLATLWRWRYELVLLCSLPLGIIMIIQVAGRDWGIAEMSTLICTIGAWPAGRHALAARAWCVITPHRVRVACVQARIHSRRGSLPVILFTSQEPFGERVRIWCTGGVCAEDFRSARSILRATCLATDVRVQRSARYAQLVTLDVIRRSVASPADS
jgi:hypothetical protein